MKFMECAVRDVIYETNVHIVKPVSVYGCKLRDNVPVSPFVEIQKGCVIGSGSRIRSHTLICGDVTLGKNCFIGHNMTLVSDLFRSGAPNPSPGNWINITLRDPVTVDNGAVILSPYICNGAVIGAGAVVAKPIENKGIYVGNPARLIRIL